MKCEFICYICWKSCANSFIFHSKKSLIRCFSQLNVYVREIFMYVTFFIGWLYSFEGSDSINVSIMNGKSQPIRSDQLRSSALSLTTTDTLYLSLLSLIIITFLRSHYWVWSVWLYCSLAIGSESDRVHRSVRWGLWWKFPTIEHNLFKHTAFIRWGMPQQRNMYTRYRGFSHE